MRSSSSSSSSSNNVNPRVLSGYRFNNVGGHNHNIDQLINTLLPHSDPSRITRFKTCLCFYDGTKETDMEIYDYGECDIDMHFSNSLRTHMPISLAISSLSNALQVDYNLKHESWLHNNVNNVNNVLSSSIVGPATLRFRDRALKDATVLSNTNVIDVSQFMDSYS